LTLPHAISRASVSCATCSTASQTDFAVSTASASASRPASAALLALTALSDVGDRRDVPARGRESLLHDRLPDADTIAVAPGSSSETNWSAASASTLPS
jgi:hypothetical protein